MNPILETHISTGLLPHQTALDKKTNAPLSERQIGRSRVCAQTLCCATHDDRDRGAVSLAQDSLARTLRNGTHAQQQKDLAVKRDRKVRVEGEEMWADTRETSREPSGVVGKVAHGAPVDFRA